MADGWEGWQPSWETGRRAGRLEGWDGIRKQQDSDHARRKAEGWSLEFGQADMEVKRDEMFQRLALLAESSKLRASFICVRRVNFAGAAHPLWFTSCPVLPPYVCVLIGLPVAVQVCGDITSGWHLLHLQDRQHQGE